MTTTKTDLDDLLVAVALHAGWSWIPYRWYDDSVKKLLWKYNLGLPQGDDFYHLPDGSLLPWPGSKQLPNFPAAVEATLDVLDTQDSYLVEIEKEHVGAYNVRVWRKGYGFDAFGASAAEALCRAYLKSREEDDTTD